MGTADSPFDIVSWLLALAPIIVLLDSLMVLRCPADATVVAEIGGFTPLIRRSDRPRDGIARAAARGPTRRARRPM